MFGLFSSLKKSLLVLHKKVWTAKNINLLWTNFSGRWGFSPQSKIWHKLCLVYVLGFLSSKPSNFWKSKTLAWSYNLQSNRKCSTDSRLPHWQYFVIDRPIGNRWQFRKDLPSLSCVCRVLGYLKPQWKCLNLWGFSFSFSLILNSVKSG